MRIIELFAGIGACSVALKRIGINIEIIDAVEIDKYAIASFNAMHGTNFEIQDITLWDKDFKNIDLITHGSPCQDFSLAGKQAGGDFGSGTRSSLMYETIRIVGKIRPKYVLWENVKNVLSKKHRHNFERYINTLNTLGYNSYYQVLNAKDYGIPQNRERVFTVSIRKDIDKGNFKFPEKEELKLTLKDILEEEVDTKYYLSEYELENIKKSTFNQNQRRIQEKEYFGTLCARDWKNPKCVQVSSMGKGGGKVPIIKEKISNENKGVVIQKESKVNQMVLNSRCKRLKSLVEKTEFEVGKVLSMDLYNQTTNEEISQCLTEPHHNTQRLFDGLRIRKLTPKECWRLMGFSDEDFAKVANIPTSNTQLYKQAR